MGGETQPLTDEVPTPPPGSHRRILVKMGAIIIVGALIGFAFVTAKVGLGVLIGGVLAYANYFWQRHSLKAIFDRAIIGRKSRFLAARYILRYVVISLVLAI